MPQQTLFIVNPAHLSVTNNQLEICLHEPEQVFYRSFEDIERIIIDHYAVYLTVPLINRLSENNISVVFCNEQHYPTTMLMDLDSNYVQTKHFRNQLEATLPLKKRMWKQIVECKIQNQSNLLQKLGMGNDL